MTVISFKGVHLIEIQGRFQDTSENHYPFSLVEVRVKDLHENRLGSLCEKGGGVCNIGNQMF